MCSVVLHLVVLAFQSVTTHAQTKRPPAKLDPLPAFVKSHQIEIITADPVFPVKLAHGEVNGKKADARVLHPFLAIFVDEFSLYPPDLTKRARLMRVVICIELKFAGQLRTAVPDWEYDTLYLDAARGANNKNYVRTVLHHEFFHMVDVRDDGSLYKDERWARLNPKDFRYGTGGRNAQDLATTSVLTDKFPGFLNHYSTTGVEEDKAEIFAHMMVQPERIAEQSGKDPVLKAKCQRMRELLKAFCPNVNADFWERVRKRSVN